MNDDADRFSDACAISLLGGILASGASRRVLTSKPVPIPPPSHLALLNTLIIHPFYTTRTEKHDHLEISSMALGYLRNLLTVVGPINADLRTAFQFIPAPRTGRRTRMPSRGSDNDSDMTDVDSHANEDRLRGKLANQSSVWSRGNGFWSTIGWAFNCSVVHPRRWTYWKLWLEFMLEVLEADWDERERRDGEVPDVKAGADETSKTWRHDTLVLMYMDQKDGRQGLKGIIKALFADGRGISSSAFPEVFDNEPRGPRKQSRKRKREEVLDLENGKYGDYFNDDSNSSGGSEPPTPEKLRARRSQNNGQSISSGLAESVALRLRLFRLLSAVTFTMREPSELVRLYEDFARAVQVLPLETFALFIGQRSNPLLPETHITLLKELFRLLLPSSYKDPRQVDAEADAKGGLTMPMLEQCYAPYPANTVDAEDNAKLSLVVESTMQLLWACEMLEGTDDFGRAVEAGIKAREAKVKKKKATGRMKADGRDDFAQGVLSSSAMRIRVLLEAMMA